MLCYPVNLPEERRDQILLNELCLLKGWSPLHYAAAEGSSSGVSTLLAAGASVNVPGAVLSGIDANTTSSTNGAGAGEFRSCVEVIGYRRGDESGYFLRVLQDVPCNF